MRREKSTEAIIECARLTASFAYLVDHHRYEEMAVLFTEDCTFTRPGASIAGRGALQTFMEARPTDSVSRHICTAPFFETIEADAATAVTYLVFCEGEALNDASLASLGSITTLAEYHDIFKRTASGWKIAARDVRPVMLLKR
jgi:hypothetical protein